MDRFKLIVLLAILLTGCAPSSEPKNSLISVSRRGESLKETESAPVAVAEPVVLPAVEISEESEGLENVAVSIAVGSSDSCEVLTNPQFESDVIRQVNAARNETNGSLIEHSLLTQVARFHSQEMACSNYFSHESPSLGSVELRLQAAGYEFVAIGENIASGYADPVEVVLAWLASSGHRENLLSLEYIHIGVGYAKLAEDDQPAFWTIVLAAPE